MLASRRRSACDREPGGLGLLGAEGLHDDDAVDALVDDVRHVADEALRVRRPGPSVRRWYSTFSAVIAGKSSRATKPSTQSVANIQAVAMTTSITVPLAYGSGPSTCDDASASDCTCASSSPVGFSWKYDERLVLVAVDDAASQDRGDAHLGAAGVDPAEHDPRGAHRTDDHERDDSADQRVDLDVAVREPRRDHVVDDPPEHERLRDRAEREDRRTTHGDRERLGLEPDVPSHHLRAAAHHRTAHHPIRGRVKGRGSIRHGSHSPSLEGPAAGDSVG